MYQTFDIVSVEARFEENKIIVCTNFDIDASSVNETTVKLYSKADKIPCALDYKVEGKELSVVIEDEVTPNTEYVLIVSKVKNILGDKLTSGIRRKIIFTSAVKEIPVILSPSEQEEISELKVALKSVIEQEGTELSDGKVFFVQIAEDVAFINLELETTIDSAATTFKNLKSGQHFIRARVESITKDGREYGKWSETVSFQFKGITVEKPDTDFEVPDDEPVFIESFEVIGSPENGETPESILIEFSREIDPDFLDKIIVIRRDI